MPFFKLSFLFWFLPVVLGVYYATPAHRRNLVLLAFSVVFYAFSSLDYLPLLLASIVVDYLIAGLIARSEEASRRRLWLTVSLCANFGLLGYFKYAGLITATLRDVFALHWLPVVHAALPVGISFYTFQSMSYTIDVYRGRERPAQRFSDYAAFVTMFPQLIAGPIVRYSDIHAQLESRDTTLERFAHGVFLVVIGMAKKLLVADTCAELSQPYFETTSPGVLAAWTSMLLYAGQIYFDFSGYTDMAIGLARMLGFELPKNFDSPYQATSFSDFWRRWHITLSSWLRDYLYVSLGGNRRGTTRTYLNLSITMLLGGLWHGASWNFALWGALHGGYLVVERVLRERWQRLAPPLLLRRALVFVLVVIAWVPFKLERFDQTRAWWAAMFGAAPLGTVAAAPLAGVGAFLLLACWPTNSGRFRIELSPAQTAYALLLFALSIFVGYGRVAASPFLYFRF